LALGCLAKDNKPESLPKKVAKKVKLETIDRAWVFTEKQLLLHKANGTSRRLSGILELPSLEMLGTSNQALKKQGQSPFLTKKRGISNSQVTEPIWQLTEVSIVDNPDLVWIDCNQLDSATLSGPHKRWIQEILQKDQLELL